MTFCSRNTIWRWRNEESSLNLEGHLEANWEVELSAMSDNYTPDEVDAGDLLRIWATDARKRYADGLIPIVWFVDSDEGKSEFMPFQEFGAANTPRLKNFLTYFTWPTNSKTDQPLNWLELPVADKRWIAGRADKGGFIQEATGWKPGILQPFVFLPSLMSVLR